MDKIFLILCDFVVMIFLLFVILLFRLCGYFIFICDKEENVM